MYKDHHIIIYRGWESNDIFEQTSDQYISLSQFFFAKAKTITEIYLIKNESLI